ncbi:hypothetical protein M4D50_09315 [Rothia sp. p3-SID1597]|nr:hypothetical protein [Rothia sp. p3-SID1597]
MTETLVFSMRAMGAVVDIVAREGISTRFLAALEDSWADCIPSPAASTDSAESSADVRIYVVPQDASIQEEPEDGAVLRVGPESEWPFAAQDFTSLVTIELIKKFIVKLHLFHAAALMRPETGETLALIGPSGRGKTTASRALASSGWTYLSDETCAIDPETLVVKPYPKPLSVIEHQGSPKAQLAASSLGLRTPTDADSPVPTLSRLIILDRLEGEGDEPVGLFPVTLLQGLQCLAEQSSGLAQTPHALRELARLVDRVGGISKVRYRDSSELPDLLASVSNTIPEPHDETWEYFASQGSRDAETHVLSQDVRPASTQSLADDCRISRSPQASGLLTNEGLLIMHADRTVLYTPLGADLWLLTEGGATVGELRSRLEQIYGPPPEGAFELALDAVLEDGALIVSSSPASAEEPSALPSPADEAVAGSRDLSS